MENGANNPINDGSDKGTDLDFFDLGSSDLDIAKKGDTNLSSEQKLANDKKEADEKAFAEKAKKDAELLAAEEAKKGTNSNNSDDNFEAVEIDGKQYKLDKEGNALAADGVTVFKTKEELDKMSDSDDSNNDSEPFIEVYKKKVGIEIIDETTGKPKVYEDSEEGLIAYNNDVREKQRVEDFKAVLNSHPDIKRYYEYLRRGGSPTEYHKQISNSWKAVMFDSKNEDMAVNAIVANLVRTGVSNETAKKTAQMYKDSNNLESVGKENYEALVRAEDEIDNQRTIREQQLAKQEEEETESHWKDVETTIKKGTINNISIPDSERDTFFKYVAISVDKQGRSQAVIDNETLTTEQWLQLEYIKFKKLDLSKLIEAGVKTQKVKSLRERFSGGQSGLGGGEGINKNKHQRSGDINEISIDNMM